MPVLKTIDMATQQLITNSLWFDDQAEEAARFYTSLIPGSSIGNITRYGKEGYEQHQRPEGSVMTITFNLGGVGFTAINGGPVFKFNPSISFFIMCETEQETDKLWNELLRGGMALMPLDKYAWSDKYGWVMDRYGLSWQVAWGKLDDVGQKIAPSLMFTGAQHGRAEEALRLYTSIFDNSSVTGILKYGPNEEDKEGTVKHAQITLAGQTFMVMDSGYDHGFGFNEAISFIVHCNTQQEIDHYWNRLTQDGEEGPCGWLKDKFGVSWQVVPAALQKMLQDADRTKTERVTKAFMQMKKMDIATLEQAFNG